MMYLIDASACIYAGALAKRSRHWNNKGFPTGGLYKLFHYVMYDYKRIQEMHNGKGTVIICFDSPTQTYRSKEYDSYKANRKGRHNNEQSEIIIAQMKVAYDYLTRMGFNTMRKEGYEADDIIYSIVKANPTEPITIRCDDNDINDTQLFNKKIELKSVAGFNTSRKPGTTISSILYGCPSDNIKALPKIIQTGLLKAYDPRYIPKKGEPLKFNPFLFADKGTERMKYIKKYLEVLKVPEAHIPMVAKNIFLVQPMFIQDIEEGFYPTPKLDKELMSILLNALGFKAMLKSLLKQELDYTKPGVKKEFLEIYNSLTPEALNYVMELDQATQKTTNTSNKKQDQLVSNNVKYANNELNKETEYIQYTKNEKSKEFVEGVISSNEKEETYIKNIKDLI